MIDPTAISIEIRDLAEEVRRVFEDLECGHGPRGTSALTDWTPEIDVFETKATFEIRVSLPGVAPESVRVLVKRGTLVVAGEKAPPDATEAGRTRFHLVERGFGRFARAVQLARAVDAQRGQAALVSGELRIMVPKIDERRGKEILIPIEPAS